MGRRAQATGGLLATSLEIQSPGSVGWHTLLTLAPAGSIPECVAVTLHPAWRGEFLKDPGKGERVPGRPARASCHRCAFTHAFLTSTQPAPECYGIQLRTPSLWGTSVPPLVPPPPLDLNRAVTASVLLLLRAPSPFSAPWPVPHGGLPQAAGRQAVICARGRGC